MKEQAVVLNTNQDRVLVSDTLGVSLAKLYFSPDKKKLRIVLPRLVNFAQTRIDPDHHLIDVTLDGIEAQRELRR